MAIDKDTIKQVAHLSRIDLKPEELERLFPQLKGIVDFIDKLKELDIQGIPATSHILPIQNIFRQDVPAGSLPSEKTLENAPAKENSFFIVPKIIE